MRQPTRKPHFYRDGDYWFVRFGAWTGHHRNIQTLWLYYLYCTQWKKNYA